MAKRKRLSPAAVMGGVAPTASSTAPALRATPSRPPIADVSGDAAKEAALREVTEELRSAREGGRMVLELPLDQVDETHLVRDRVVLDPEEMAVLTDSLRERGQQTPIEVVQTGPGQYGLISGWRRLTALRALASAGEPFGTVQALIRAPETASEAYRAMVEENEVRANLSFYERARIAVQAARQGIYPNAAEAVQGLFAAAPSAKRSKIRAFTALVEALDDRLQFPAAIPEKLGLPLSARLGVDPGFRRTVSEALRKAKITRPAHERLILEMALNKAAKGDAAAPKAKPAKPAPEEILPGLTLAVSRRGIALAGDLVDEDLISDLRAWLQARKSG